MPPGQTVAVVVDDEATASAHAASDHAWWVYATEVLDHLRLPFHQVSTVDAELLDGDLRVLVFTLPPVLDAPTQGVLERWARRGGAILAIGGPGDLAGLLGADAGAPVDHAHVRVLDSELWTSVPDVALHAVGGVRLRAGADADVRARWDDGSPAFTVRRLGAGVGLTCGVDLWQSIVRIQQGYPVLEDGTPASDGTAPIDDNLLKCDDGLALSFEDDRELPPGQPPVPQPFEHVHPPMAAAPMFHRPHADLWRSVFLQSLWWAAEQVDAALPWLYYWPAGVPAVAHMSHDSDDNVEDHGRTALEVFAEADVRVTWCQAFPGGYSPETYAAISAAGHEQALHYNAMHDADIAAWGWPQLRAQYAWAQAVTGTERIVSNKNHYTRWEGWTEFYVWCERLGIEIDQSRGPSKQGGVGFPFGTAHVSFPIADVAEDNRLHDVLILPLHTQDLALAAHESVRDVIIDNAVAQHGVAHFLFHGPHLHLRPATRKACLVLAEEVRRRGMPWWTSAEINDWERTRREVRLTVTPSPGGWVVRSEATAAVDGAAVLVLLPGLDALPRIVSGEGSVGLARRHGRDFVELTVDVPAGTASWTIAR